MKNAKFRTYYFLCLIGIALASFYPLYMGAKVLVDYVRFGYVLSENYPKYLIPYTPVSVALIGCTALLPLSMKCKKGGQLWLTLVGISLFLTVELLLEQLVIADKISQSVSLEDWQLYMCIAPVTPSFDQQVILSLVGDYSPTFKIHFYSISMLIILTVLNCFYGFGRLILTGQRSRLKPLILQAAATVLFLGLCILACFTAFFRSGSIRISTLSAALMALFFIVFGMISGMFVLSFLTHKPRVWALLPGAVSGLMTLLMYIGEMCLLNGNLYRFGHGWLFEPLGAFPLAPVDILIVLLSFAVTAVISRQVLPKNCK